jgi:hypothetical protein
MVPLIDRAAAPQGLLSLRYIDGTFLKVLLATIERQKRQRRGRAKPGRPCDAGGRDRAA